MTERQQLRENLEVHGEVPEGADLSRLIITFTLDSEPVRTAESVLYGWADMQTAPAVGDHVMLRALGLDDPGVATVISRGWIEHNWMMVYLKRVDVAPEAANAERKATVRAWGVEPGDTVFRRKGTLAKLARHPDEVLESYQVEVVELSAAPDGEGMRVKISAGDRVVLEEHEGFPLIASMDGDAEVYVVGGPREPSEVDCG